MIDIYIWHTVSTLHPFDPSFFLRVQILAILGTMTSYQRGCTYTFANAFSQSLTRGTCCILLDAVIIVVIAVDIISQLCLFMFPARMSVCRSCGHFSIVFAGASYPWICRCRS